jgi:hypothetical protein
MMEMWHGQPVYRDPVGEPYVRVSLLDLLGHTELGVHIRAAKMGLRAGEYTVEYTGENSRTGWCALYGTLIGAALVASLVLLVHFLG